MANGEGWQSAIQRLALVNTHSRPAAHKQKEVAHLASPYTLQPFLSFPQGEEDSIAFLPF